MHITDLPKDIQRLLLNYWSIQEINSRLDDPEYFFDQVVNPYLDYLRKSGTPTPRVRLQRSPLGQLKPILMPL